MASAGRMRIAAEVPTYRRWTPRHNGRWAYASTQQACAWQLPRSPGMACMQQLQAIPLPWYVAITYGYLRIGQPAHDGVQLHESTAWQ